MDLSIAIPCCNEEDAVPDLVTGLFPMVEQLRCERSVEVIFVDDGSKDRTYELLQQITADQHDMRIVRHPVNQRVGAALRTGVAQVQGNIVVVTDSDGTYRFESIPVVFELLKPGIDIVTASPYHRRIGIDNVPAYRVDLSRSSSLIYQVLVDWHISTYTEMFRAYRLEVVRRVPFYSNGFLSAAEMLVNAILMGYKVAEYPAVLHSRQAGASKAKIWRMIRSHLRFQWHVLLCRLRLVPVPRTLDETVGRA